MFGNNNLFLLALLIIAAICLCQNTMAENFTVGCPVNNNTGNTGMMNKAHQMCHEIAYKNCRIPTWTDNSCWTETYLNCLSNCNRNRGAAVACDCTRVASQKCRLNDAPAEECYQSVYQKCMAGMGLAPDPDR